MAVVIAPCLVTPAFAHEGAEEDKHGIAVVIDTEALKSSPEAMTMWVAYAMARAAALTERAERGETLTAGDDFDVELAGREMLTSDELQRKTDEASDAYFALLRKVKAAGFLEEYVIAGFSRPGWTIPAGTVRALDFAGFEAFVRMNPLGNHHPTYAHTELHGKRWAEAAGEDLLEPATLQIDGAGCSKTQGIAAAELAKWNQTADGLRGAPVGSETRAEFVRNLMVAKANGQIAERGATWVSTRPAWLAFFAGVCAARANDLDRAERSLWMSTLLRPVWAPPRLQLASVLIGQNRLSDAELMNESAMLVTSDPCERANAYLRRGSIRLHQGRQLDARADFRTALTYAPDHKGARHELEAIDESLRNAGVPAGEPWSPPDGTDLNKAKCQPT